MNKRTLIFSLTFLIFAFACKKTIQPERPPSVLYISGLVTDKQTGVPLDSVEVTLNVPGYYGPPSPQSYFYSNTDGKFSFQFSPKTASYQLGFSKNGYCYAGCPYVSIDRDKEYQTFNVLLEK